MGSPVEEEEEAAEATGSPALPTGSGTVTGATAGAGEGSSGSTGSEGSVTGALVSNLSTGGSGCTSPGEEDFWTAGSNFGVSSRRRTQTRKKKKDSSTIIYFTHYFIYENTLTLEPRIQHLLFHNLFLLAGLLMPLYVILFYLYKAHSGW